MKEYSKWVVKKEEIDMLGRTAEENIRALERWSTGEWRKLRSSHFIPS